MVHFERNPNNPIIVPGQLPWRQAAVFNPAVLYDNGEYFLYERAAVGLRPFQCHIGLLKSSDGVNFTHVSDQPVLTGAMIGYPHASLQDPRVVKIDGLVYLIYAMRPYANNCNPTGVGLPEYSKATYPGWDGDQSKNVTRSAIAVSEDGVHFRHLGYTTPEGLDDRDNILFPEKIQGRFALLRRPQPTAGHPSKPSMWLSYSQDLLSWSEPELLAKPEYDWEGGKIGGSTPPLRTEKGWLVLYHGVDKHDVYRVGAMLLDLENPAKILARTAQPIMEPQEYYERFGLVLPNVIFPTGNIIKDGILSVYYGCCDTCIGLATIPVQEILRELGACRT